MRQYLGFAGRIGGGRKVFRDYDQGVDSENGGMFLAGIKVDQRNSMEGGKCQSSL